MIGCFTPLPLLTPQDLTAIADYRKRRHALLSLYAGHATFPCSADELDDQRLTRCNECAVIHAAREKMFAATTAVSELRFGTAASERVSKYFMERCIREVADELH